MSLKNVWIIACLSLFPNACTETPVVVKPQVKAKTVATPVAKKPLLPPSFAELPTEVANLLKASGLSPDGLSVYIQSLNDPAPLLAFNADVPRNPASVMKLVTTYASLGTLGADYRWPIELYTTGEVAGDTLNGDLILKGYGDPNFKSGDLRHLLDELRALGVKKIVGKIIIDNTYFSIVKHDTGEFDGKRYAAYNAQSDALLYAEGVSYFVVRGHEVFSPNPARNIKIENNLTFKEVACSGRFSRLKTGIHPEKDYTRITFDGVYSSRCPERRYAFVITDPENMLHSTLSKVWTEDMGGIIEGGDFAVTATPANAKLLVKIEAEPVSEILPMINKKSNNVMAQQLFLSIGAKQAGAGDTTEKAYQGIQEWFRSRGLDFPELRMENGSGLSRNGQISARHIGELLLDAYSHPQRDVFIESLPILGVDGTLKNRMRGTQLAGHGHLKTGTLNNAKALAGYVTGADGETYIVAILHNDPAVKYKARPIHDKIMEWTARQKAKPATTQPVAAE